MRDTGNHTSSPSSGEEYATILVNPAGGRMVVEVSANYTPGRLVAIQEALGGVGLEATVSFTSEAGTEAEQQSQEALHRVTLDHIIEVMNGAYPDRPLVAKSQAGKLNRTLLMRYNRWALDGRINRQMYLDAEAYGILPGQFEMLYEEFSGPKSRTNNIGEFYLGIMQLALARARGKQGS